MPSSSPSMSWNEPQCHQRHWLSLYLMVRFLNPFFSFSARKKRTVSSCQEKKEGIVPTVVPEFSQKIPAFLCPFHPSLLSERASRSARAFRRHLLCGSNTAPVGADDSVRPYRTRISPQTSAKPSLPTAGRTESSAPTILSYFFRIPFAAESKGAPRNQTVTQQRGHSLERKKEQADTELSASAGSAVQRASSDAAAILFFLRKEAKRMGAQMFSEKQKENAVNSPFLKENRKQARKRHLRTISIVPA